MSYVKRSDGSEQMGNQETPESQLRNDEGKIRQLEEELDRVKAELEQYRVSYENLSVLEATLRTRCQQAEAEIQTLRSSEQRWRSVFENAPDQIFTCDRNGKLLSFNHTIPGFTVEQVVDTSIYDYVSPDHHPTLERAFQQVFQTGETVHYETMGVGANGAVAWYSSRVGPIWRDGQVVEAVVVCTDITDRKRTEADLQQSNAYYQSLANVLPQCLYRKDLNGRLTFANQSLLTMLGKSLEESLGLTVYDCYPKNLADQYAADDAWVIQTGMTLDTVEQHQILSTSETICIQVVKTPVRDEAGHIIGTQGIFWDITERTRLEQALQASEAKLSDILNNAVAAITSFRVFENQKWQHEYWSAGCEVLFGYTPDELFADRTLWASRVFVEDAEDILGAETFEAIYSGHSIVHEYRFRHKDGSLRWISATLASRRDETANCWIVTVVNTDISDRKYIENQRQQAETALRESEERFRQLAENIQKVFWMVSLTDGNQVIYVSPAYEEIWQRSCESAYQHPRNWIDAIHSEDQDRVVTALESLSEGNYDIEYRIVRPDGSICWIHDRAFPVQSKDGKVYRVAGIAEDITERKRAEDVLRQQAERERLLGDIAQRIRQSLNLDEILNTTVTEVRRVLQADRTIIFRFQPDGNGIVAVEAVVPAWTAILGLTIHSSSFVEDYIERYRQGHIRTVEDIFTSDLEESYLAFLAQFQIRANLVVPILQDNQLWGLLIANQCSAPRKWRSYEVNLLKQLATQLEIAIYQSQLFQQVKALNTDLEQQIRERTTKLQKAVEFEALLRRITDKVRDSLEESQILQTAVQELGIGLQTYSCDTGVYDLEQGCSTICYEYVCPGVGIPSSAGTIVPFAAYSEIYNQVLQGYYPQFCWLPDFADPARLTDDLFTMLICPIMDDQKVIGDLWLYRAKENVFEEVEIRLIQQVANHCAIALRQSRLYQSAQAQVEELERLNHLKDDFLNTVSHELRTPVSNIRMAAQMLEINLGRLGILASEPNSVTRYLNILKEECQREISLINDLLDLTRLEAEIEPLIWNTIDLSTWLAYITEPFLERARSQSQQLSITVLTEPLVLTTDISYLERILAELLQNACKYTPVNETIQVIAQTQAPYIEICVSNTGVEIPEDELEHIFDKFYRIPTIDPWKHGGTGLGLALVKRLVARLDGTISVTSAMGRVTFTLQFPHALAAASPTS